MISMDGSRKVMPCCQINSRLLLLLGIVVVLIIRQAEGATECYECQARLKQNKTLKECSGTEDDCENCLEGLQEYSWTPFSFCGPEGIAIVEGNMNVSLSYGSTAVLRCQFQVPVICVWQKNEFQEEALQYITGSDGNNTTDCSTQIRADWETAGTWDCKSLAEADKDAINGLHVTITLKATITEAPKNASVHSGENGTLSCHFDMRVPGCFWMHNGTQIEISDKYSFSAASGDGQNTTDCSIDIDDIRDEDSGEWRCGCTGNSFLEETISDAAWLSILPNQVNSELYKSPEWIIVLAVVCSIVATIVFISIILACIYGIGNKYNAVRQKDYELGETQYGGRPPVLLSD